MSTQVAQASTSSSQTADSTQTANTPPGKKPMGWKSILVVAIYLVVISVAVLYGLLKLWPHPTPSGQPPADSQAGSTTSPGVSASPAPASSPPSVSNGRTPLPDPENIKFLTFFRGGFQANVYAETRLLLIVMLSGALGSLLHSLRSLYWYTGNREMVWSWVALYMLLPLTGAILAVIFYFVVRGGFFSPQASFEFTSPFGFAALSALVGLFSPQAVLKLKEVAETIFTKPGAGSDAKVQESLTSAQANQAEPAITEITPASGSTAGGQKVIITGTGFASNPTVLIGKLPAKVLLSTSTTIVATTPASASGAGAVDVEVSNPNGKKATLSNGYTYETATTPNPNDGGNAG